MIRLTEYVLAGGCSDIQKNGGTLVQSEVRHNDLL